MKNMKTLLILCLAAFASSAMAADAPKKSAAQLEKEKALANPYPNDYGPDHLTAEELKDYPADKKAGYKVLLVRCAQCHTPSRPLNSRFVELDGKTIPEWDAAAAKLKSTNPELFKDKSVWDIEEKIQDPPGKPNWNRYVKKMLNKPGCGKAAGGQMTNEEAKQIYQFLVYDSQHRKLGANAEKWKAHRAELVEKLKTEKPARYEELKKDNDL